MTSYIQRRIRPLDIGLDEGEFPENREALCRKLVQHGMRIQDLFTKDRTEGVPCWISRQERGGWDHRYHCKATTRLDEKGDWEAIALCGRTLGGEESYYRHVKTTHLRVPRDGKLVAWASGILAGKEP